MVVLLGATACGSSNAQNSAGTTESTSQATNHDATPHFTYEGADGPANWGKLDPAWATCADGSAQSPINIVSPTPADLADPVINYAAGPAKVVNNGHTIEAEAPEGSSVTVDGITYPFVQMHFHSPSEHTLDGTHAAAELHFVNKTTDGKILVLAVLVQQGDTPNAALEPFISAASVKEGAEKEVELDFPAIVETGPSNRYAGSLTTPPCTEGVSWVLMAKPISVSADQLAALRAAYDGNDRPVQALDGRTVQLDTTP